MVSARGAVERGSGFELFVAGLLIRNPFESHYSRPFEKFIAIAAVRQILLGV
jgi:hypothetical protein